MGVIATAGCTSWRIRYKRTACDSEQGRQNKRLRFLSCRPSWRRSPFTWKLCVQRPYRRRAPPCCSSPLSATLSPRHPTPNHQPTSTASSTRTRTHSRRNRCPRTHRDETALRVFTQHRRTTRTSRQRQQVQYDAQRLPAYRLRASETSEGSDRCQAPAPAARPELKGDQELCGWKARFWQKCVRPQSCHLPEIKWRR